MNRIHACWWQEVSNFGDMITPYLVEKISGARPIATSPGYLEEPTLFAAGSILQFANEQSVIWGTGFIEEPPRAIKVKAIHAVRGPLTRTCLLKFDIPCPAVYGDLGVLLPRYYNPTITKKYAVGIVPHYVDKDCELLKEDPDWHIIDVQAPVEDVVDAMLSCECILSSSLHGLIVASAYGIPTCWIKLSDKIYGRDFKFRDYYASLEREVFPAHNIQQGIANAEVFENTSADALLAAYPRKEFHQCIYKWK